jgi:hypothetical protein
MLAISTDLQAPKDIDVIALYITTDGRADFDYMGRVLPDGIVALPATIAVIAPSDPSAQVRIRAVAFKSQPDGSAVAKVARDVLTTVPQTGTYLLPLQLSFLDVGSVSGAAPASAVPDGPTNVPDGLSMYDPTDPVPTDPGYLTTTCNFVDDQETSIAGQCASAVVASSKLQPFSPSLVFGPGGSATSPVCFRASCFANEVEVSTAGLATSSSGCSVALPAGTAGPNVNLGVSTDGLGACSNGVCIVPLSQDPTYGFTLSGSSATLIPGVCSLLAKGAKLYADGTSCPTKVDSQPVCQSATGDAGAPPDAGADASTCNCPPGDICVQQLGSSVCVHPNGGADAGDGGSRG